MAHVTRTVYTGERNKGLSSAFQPPEEDRSVQRSKRCDKHGNKDEDNSPKNVNKTADVDFLWQKRNDHSHDKRMQQTSIQIL